MKELNFEKPYSNFEELDKKMFELADVRDAEMWAILDELFDASVCDALFGE